MGPISAEKAQTLRSLRNSVPAFILKKSSALKFMVVYFKVVQVIKLFKWNRTVSKRENKNTVMKSNANTHEGEKQQSSHLYREKKINVISRVKWKVLSDFTAQRSKMKTTTHWNPGSLMWFWEKSTVSVWLSLLHKHCKHWIYSVLSNYCFMLQGLMSLTLNLYMSDAHRRHLWPGHTTASPHSWLNTVIFACTVSWEHGGHQESCVMYKMQEQEEKHKNTTEHI